MNQSTFFTTLTPLRGIAALMVVIYHVPATIASLTGPQPPTQLIASGYLWVDFFFILSGFILSHVYGANFRNKVTWANYRRYLLARFARIYPLHLLTLLGCVLVILPIKALAEGIMPYIESIINLDSVPLSLLLIQSLHVYPTVSLNVPAWSLSTEWWAYVLFPLLVGPFFRLKSIGTVTVLVLIIGLYLLLVYYISPRFGNQFAKAQGIPVPTYSIGLTMDWGYPRCLAGFTLGMLFYELYRVGWGYWLLQRSWSFGVVASSVLLSMHLGWHELLIISLFPWVVLTAAYNEGSVKRALNLRPLQRLGDWSYSIYMVHNPLIYVGWLTILTRYPNFLTIPTFIQRPYAPTLLDGWLICLTLVVSTIGLASLTYRYVEVPARNYLNARFKGRSPEPMPVAL